MPRRKKVKRATVDEIIQYLKVKIGTKRLKKEDRERLERITSKQTWDWHDRYDYYEITGRARQRCRNLLFLWTLTKGDPEKLIDLLKNDQRLKGASEEERERMISAVRASVEPKPED